MLIINFIGNIDKIYIFLKIGLRSFDTFHKKGTIFEVKSRRFKKPEWICSHHHPKVEQFKSRAK